MGFLFSCLLISNETSPNNWKNKRVKVAHVSSHLGREKGHDDEGEDKERDKETRDERKEGRERDCSTFCSVRENRMTEKKIEMVESAVQSE